MDRIGADFDRAVETMRDRLGANPLPIQLPIGAEDKFIGVVDLIENKALVWKDELGTEFEYEEIPENLVDAAHEARTHLIEACADYDDELMEMYLDEQEIPHERIAKSLHRATLDLKVTPVLAGSAFKNKGVQPLLDAIVELLPSPLEVPPMKALAHQQQGRGWRGGRAQARRLRAVRRARLQGHVRPVRRQAHLLPRLLRPSRHRVAASSTRPTARPSASAAC